MDPITIAAILGLIGAVGGAGINAWGNSRKNSERQKDVNSPYGKESTDTLQELLKGGTEGIKNTPLDFGPIREATMARYNNEVVPSLAQRFTSDLGQGQSSSGFLGSMFGGQADLQQQLAGQEQLFNQDKYKNLLNQLQLGLGSRTYDNSPNFLQSLGSNISDASPGIAQLGYAYGMQQPQKQMSNTQNALGNYSPKQQSDIIRNIAGKYQLGPKV